MKSTPETIKSVYHTFFRDALSVGFVAKSVGQHFTTPRIESVIAKYDSIWPFAASSKVDLIDMASSLQCNNFISS